jgi:hypothetical protein
MIARQWKGVVDPKRIEDYLSHLSTETFVSLKKLRGFKQAIVLRRNISEGVEVIVLTIWESLDAIKQFTGDDISISIVPSKAQVMMKSFDEFATHFEISLQT